MCAAERPRVLIAGGGVAALEAVLTLEEIAGDRVDITLLTSNPRFDYRPLSVAEPFSLGTAHRFELSELLDGRGIETIVDGLESIDAKRGEVQTTDGLTLGYSALLVAVGGRRREALPGAITFSGSEASAEIGGLLRSAESGRIGRLVFAVPAGVTWSLPAYELALMTNAHFTERDIPVKVAVVTRESRPVDDFGSRHSETVGEMLRSRGIAFHTAVAIRAEAGRLVVEGGEPIPADAIVALPEIVAPRITGLPRDDHGFLPTDRHGRVRDMPGVYAAGDVTSFPLKQGGLAAQQADAAAESIAADLGVPVEPQPFQPVLRGLLLTGRAPRHLRAEVMRGRTSTSPADEETDRRPPAKISGRRLGPLLARHGAAGGAPPGAVALELNAPVSEIESW